MPAVGAGRSRLAASELWLAADDAELAAASLEALGGSTSDVDDDQDLAVWSRVSSSTARWHCGSRASSNLSRTTDGRLVK